MTAPLIHKPSPAFIAASWVALLLGTAAYLTGLFNAAMPLNEKGCYLTLLLFGLFAAVSLQKNTGDLIAAGGGSEKPKAIVPALAEED